MKKTFKDITLGLIEIDSFNLKKSLWPEWHRASDIAEDYNERYENPPDEIVLKSGRHYNLIITYPLSVVYKTVLYTGEKGLTRRQLANEICKVYRRIYQEENKTSSISEQYIPGMYNRVTTDGKYGIWGHVIGDLVLHTATVKGRNITVGVSS